MVYLKDEGSVFDAPIDKIWKYMQSEEHHHHSMKLVSREVNGNVVTITSERTINGKTVRVKVRNTVYPPFGVVQEHLEGPLAGSRAFQYYVPKGDKTEVVVVGDYVVKDVSDENLIKQTVLAASTVSFNEDNENLKRT